MHVVWCSLQGPAEMQLQGQSPVVNAAITRVGSWYSYCLRNWWHVMECRPVSAVSCTYGAHAIVIKMNVEGAFVLPDLLRLCHDLHACNSEMTQLLR